MDSYAHSEKDNTLVASTPLGSTGGDHGFLEKGSKPPQTDEQDYAHDEFEVDANDTTRVNYRTMGWIKAGALISAETIALGILSFPSVYHRLGLIPGIITTIAFAAASWYTGYVIVQFKVSHPGVLNFSDAGGVFGGKWGRIGLGILLVVKTTMVAGSHSLSGGIALTSISSNAICSIIYALIITFVSFLLVIPRQLEKLTYISFASVTSIIIACIITMAASRSQSLEELQAATGGKDLGPVRWYIAEGPPLIDVIGALTNLIFGYGGHVAIFSFASEMKNPRDFKYSLALVQIVATFWYIVVGAVIYTSSGQYVTSPALSGTVKKFHIAAYSVALISIIVAGVVASAVGAKYIFVTMFRGTDMLTSSSRKAYLAYVGICAGVWTCAFLIAELIPFFNQLLSIISSLATVWFTYGLSSVLWWHDNSPKRSHLMKWNSGPGGYFATPAKGLLAIVNLAIFLCSIVIMVLGLYSAITSIKDGYAKGTYSHPFSCAAA